jgi:3-phenylpropionate/cinnamic acid dioxygenase small subunit
MSQEARADARTAIENLLFTYAERIDAGDFAGVGALFANASIYGPDDEVSATGAAEAKALYDKSTRVYEDGTPRTQHVTTNLILELSPDGRSASARSRFTVFQGVSGEPLQPIIAGHYHDRFALSDEEGWHFVERRMRPTLLGDLSKHLLFELDES